jgi:Galactose oxidase, central domain
MLGAHPRSAASSILLALATTATMTSATSAGVNDGTWNKLPVTGAPVVDDYAAIYDPINQEKVLFGGNLCQNLLCPSHSVYLLAINDLAWTNPTPLGGVPPDRNAPVTVYDPIGKRMLTFGGGFGITLNDVWELLLPFASPTTWNELTTIGAPDPRTAPVWVYDPPRNRVLLFGGILSASVRTNEVWALDLAGLTWSHLSISGTPPSARAGSSSIYDPNGDRLIVLGGSDGSNELNDTWQLTLSGTPTWSHLSTPHAPPLVTSTFERAVMDPVRNRMLVLEGQDLWALDLVGSPDWTLLTVGGNLDAGVGLRAPVYDAFSDRLLVEGKRLGPTAETWELSWGVQSIATVSCPGAAEWINGAILPLGYSITNPYASKQPYRWTLTSTRDWPGFPKSGVIMVNGTSTAPIPVDVAVPDTAAVGLNGLTFTATSLTGLTNPSPCSHNLHDASTGTLASLVSADVHSGLVRLTWSVPSAPGGTCEVSRQAPGFDWQVLRTTETDGTGFLTVEDHPTDAGRYGYRLRFPGVDPSTFVGETWVDVEASSALSLSLPTPQNGAGILVEFSLDRSSPASIDVFDVAGRRVAHETLSFSAGHYRRVIGTRSGVAAGMYVVRLSQDGRERHARAVVAR